MYPMVTSNSVNLVTLSLLLLQQSWTSKVLGFTTNPIHAKKGIDFTQKGNTIWMKGIQRVPVLLHGSDSNNRNAILKSTLRSDEQDEETKLESNSNSYTLDIPLRNIRPRPNSPLKKLQRLWNDPRPVGVAIMDSGDREDEEEGMIPYCIQSEVVELSPGFPFRVLLYPQGRLGQKYQASVYLSFEPKEYGDEIDLSWSLSLSSHNNGEENYDESPADHTDEKDCFLLPVMTSGGLPRSNTTWSSSMTFCHEAESVESLGRAYDWGSSIWSAHDVCNCLEHISAKLKVTVHGTRRNQYSFVSGKGALGALLERWTNPLTFKNDNSKLSTKNEKLITAGQVIVPVFSKDSPSASDLERNGIVSGVDYRVMTMSDKDSGKPIFSLHHSHNKNNIYNNDYEMDGNQNVQMALRPCGWKLQRELAQKRGLKNFNWPAEIDSHTLLQDKDVGIFTRFDVAQTAIPRIFSAFKRDSLTLSLAVLLALAPLPLALVGRTFLSFYAIPSASMAPTLEKGDLLLVEKLPNIYERTHRGDIVLFNPPSALQEIIQQQSRGRKIDSSALFVKRVVGMPGDNHVVLNRNTKQVSIDGKPAIGPNRNLCDDEPLDLLGKLLDKYGVQQDFEIEQLKENQIYVLGDCQAVSVDSRVFGTLPKDNIVGKPIARVWPLNRFRLGDDFI